MTKLFTKATVTGTSLLGSSSKPMLTALWDALNSLGATDATRTTITATATLTATQTGLRLIDATSGAITLTLQASGTAGDDTRLELRRIDSTVANAVTIQRAGADTIEGGTSITLPAGSSATLMLPAGSSNWRVLNISGSTAANVRLHIGADVARKVRGLVGTNNSGTPTTQFDLAADSVCLRDANGGTVVRQVTGNITCNFSTAGPAANGRDQVGVFTASQFVRLFFIWNGAALATIASTASPTTGPVLPTGYTHWAYATTVRWNASSNILPCYAQGAMVSQQAELQVLAAGVAIVETAVTLTSLVPTEAKRISLALETASSVGGTSFLKLVTGVNYHRQTCQANTTTQANPTMPNVALLYVVSAATTSLTINVLGYTVPNGDC